jgi:hypothetical protein
MEMEGRVGIQIPPNPDDEKMNEKSPICEEGRNKDLAGWNWD